MGMPGVLEIIIILAILAALGGGILLVVLVVYFTSSRQARGPNLQPCADCGKPVSLSAAACPHCGAPVKARMKR